MANPLASFLVSLGFQLDQIGLRKFNEALQGTHSAVRAFAVGVTGMAVAAEEAIRRTARQFENLFYLSQQTGVSVKNLQNARFAFSQIGLTANDAADAINAVQNSFFQSPGLRGLANSLVPGFKDAKDVIEGLAEQYHKLVLQYGETGPAIESATIPLRVQSEALGYSGDLLRRLGLNWPTYVKNLEQSRKSHAAFGVDSKTAAFAATEVTRSFNRLWLDVDAAFESFITRTFPAVKRLLDRLADWMEEEGAEKIKKWSKEFGDWLDKEATIENIEAGLTRVLGVVTSIGTVIDGIKDAIEWLSEQSKNLNLFENTRREFEWLRERLEEFRSKEESSGPPKPSDALRLPPGLRRDLIPGSEGPAARSHPAPDGWVTRAGDALWRLLGVDIHRNRPSVPPIDPKSPEFNTPIPPGRRSSTGGIRATPASYGGSDPNDLLLIGLRNWWSGSIAFRPIVVIADEFYNKFADTITRVFGLNAGNDTGGSETGASPQGATPGRGMTGRFGGSMRATFGKAGYSTAEALAIIEKYESEGRNIKNPGSSASGYWQALDDTWKETAGKLGIDTNKYPNAMSAPRDAQQQVAAHLFETRGFDPWARYNSRLAGAVGSGEGRSGPAPSGIGGRFGGGNVDLSKVRAALTNTVNAAAGMLPEGYKVVATSGARTGGLSDSQHHGGGALDVQIMGPDGNTIPNRGRDTTGMYTKLAHEWYNQVAKLHPEMLDKSRWGGQFGVVPGSSVADLMHFDFGGKPDGSNRGRLQTDPWRYLKGQPLGSEGGGNRNGTNINQDAKVEINVHGSNDQHATARATRDVLDRQYAMYARNLKTALA